MPEHEASARCADRGLPAARGVAVCETLFQELLALHFTSPAHFAVHRLFVDIDVQRVEVEVEGTFWRHRSWSNATICSTVCTATSTTGC